MLVIFLDFMSSANAKINASAAKKQNAINKRYVFKSPSISKVISNDFLSKKNPVIDIKKNANAGLFILRSIVIIIY